MRFLSDFSHSSGRCQETRAAGDPYGGGDDCGIHGGLDAVRSLLHTGHSESNHSSRSQAGCHPCLLLQDSSSLQPNHLRLHEQTGNWEFYHHSGKNFGFFFCLDSGCLVQISLGELKRATACGRLKQQSSTWMSCCCWVFADILIMHDVWITGRRKPERAIVCVPLKKYIQYYVCEASWHFSWHLADFNFTLCSPPSGG